MGIKKHLDQYKVSSGCVPIKGALMHWWVLNEDAHKQSHFTGLAHTGTLHQNEIYDLEISNKKSRSRLNRCGIIHLVNRIVIYAEPTTKGVFADPSRTEIFVKQGEKTPWLDWAEDFYENLPPEIARLEREASEKASDGEINIQAYDILRKWLRDFEIPKFNVKDGGSLEVSPPLDMGGSPISGESNDEKEKKKAS